MAGTLSGIRPVHLVGTPYRQLVKQLVRVQGKMAGRTGRRVLVSRGGRPRAKPGCLNSRANWLARLHVEADKWRAIVGLHHQQALCNAVKQLMRLWQGSTALQGGPLLAKSRRRVAFLLQSSRVHLCPCNGQTGYPLSGQRAGLRTSEALLLCMLLTDS